jgi:hypothetical protein
MPSPGRGIPIPVLGTPTGGALDVNPTSFYSPPGGFVTPPTTAAPPAAVSVNSTPSGLSVGTSGGNGPGSDHGGGAGPDAAGKAADQAGRGTIDPKSLSVDGLSLDGLSPADWGGLLGGLAGAASPVPGGALIGSPLGRAIATAVNPPTPENSVWGGPTANDLAKESNQNAVDNNNNSTAANDIQGVGTSVSSGNTEGSIGPGSPGNATGAEGAPSGPSTGGDKDGGKNGGDPTGGAGTGGDGSSDSGNGSWATGGAVHRRHHFDDGGSVGMPAPGGGFSGNANLQSTYQQYSQMPIEKLQELAVRLPATSPYGAIVRRALATKRMSPGGDQGGGQQMGPTAFAAAPSGFAVAPSPAGGMWAGGRAGYDDGGEVPQADTKPPRAFGYSVDRIGTRVGPHLSAAALAMLAGRDIQPDASTKSSPQSSEVGRRQRRLRVRQSHRL